MAISLASLNRKAKPKPPLMLIYGVEGIGKSTFGAMAPDPVFLWTEDGRGLLDTPGTEVLKSFDEVMQWIGVLYTDDHPYKTVIVDSVDWLEPLVWAAACKANGWQTIEQPGYGKGYVAALDLWRQYLEGLNALRNEKGMTVIQVAHAQIKRFESPDVDAFDRYTIKLQEKASALLREHADIVGFANYRVTTVKTDAGFNKKSTRGVGSGERLLHVTERPAYLAKNRFSLPDTFPLDAGAWSVLAEHVPYLADFVAPADQAAE